MKILRGIALVFVYFAAFFLFMVFTAMFFRSGWQYGLGLLGGIWLTYLACQLLRWEFLSNLLLAAFLGYAIGLLRESDKYTTQAQADFVSWLPERWVGLAGLAFLFVFVAFLPWLASVLAAKFREKFTSAKPEAAANQPPLI